MSLKKLDNINIKSIKDIAPVSLLDGRVLVRQLYINTPFEISKFDYKAHTVGIIETDNTNENNFEYYYLLKGSLLLKIDDQEQIIEEGSTFDFKVLTQAAFVETLTDVELLSITCGNYFDQYVAHYEDVDKIITVLEKRDLYTRQHSESVLGYASRIGMQMGFNQLEIKDLMIASKFHDIGKIEISLEILNKTGKLTKDEFDLMKSHPLASYQLLKGVFGERIALMALQHHERIDGSGYPQGLRDEEIIMEAKIIAVADVIDAMLSKRVYRDALSHDVVKAELMMGRGTKYDAQVVDVAIASFFR